MGKEFPEQAENYYNVVIFWGVKDLDRTGETKWDPDFIGKVIWDESFDLSNSESQ